MGLAGCTVRHSDDIRSDSIGRWKVIVYIFLVLLIRLESDCLISMEKGSFEKKYRSRIIF